jgi:glycerol uptake facilitator protein
LLAEAAGCALLTFVVASAIDRQAVPGWAGLAIGAPALVLVLVGGPAAGGAVNPVRYIGPLIAAAALGYHETWSQIPAYLTGEFAGGVD